MWLMEDCRWIVDGFSRGHAIHFHEDVEGSRVIAESTLLLVFSSAKLCQGLTMFEWDGMSWVGNSLGGKDTYHLQFGHILKLIGWFTKDFTLQNQVNRFFNSLGNLGYSIFYTLAPQKGHPCLFLQPGKVCLFGPLEISCCLGCSRYGGLDGPDGIAGPHRRSLENCRGARSAQRCPAWIWEIHGSNNIHQVQLDPAVSKRGDQKNLIKAMVIMVDPGLESRETCRLCQR